MATGEHCKMKNNWRKSTDPKILLLSKEETDFRSVQRENQRWLRVIPASRNSHPHSLKGKNNTAQGNALGKIVQKENGHARTAT